MSIESQLLEIIKKNQEEHPISSQKSEPSVVNSTAETAAGTAKSVASFTPSVDFAALRQQEKARQEYRNQSFLSKFFSNLKTASASQQEEEKKNDDFGFYNEAGAPLIAARKEQEKQRRLEENAAAVERDRQRIQSAAQRINAMPQEDLDELESYIRAKDDRDGLISDSPYQQIAADKKVMDAYDALAKKYDDIDTIAEVYARQLHGEDVQRIQEAVSEDFQQSPLKRFAHNMYAIPSAAFGGVAATYGRVNELLNRTGNLETLDPYTAYDMGNVYASAVRSEQQKRIEGEDPNFLRKGLSIGYQAASSAVDTVARGVAGGGAAGGATLAALNTFSQTVSDATQRGATPTEAWALATVNAAVEAATEKLPLDNMIDIAKGGGAKSLVKNVLRSMAIEATEEELSLVGNVLADAAIMREKSEYNQRVAQLMEDGKTQEEAREIADRELILEALNTAAVSGISGGIGGFGASKYYAYFGDRNTGLQTAQNPSGASDASAETAKNPQQDIAAGAAKDITRQAMENGSIQLKPQQTQQEAKLQSAVGAMVSDAAQKSVDSAVSTYRETGTVTNKTAEAILSNPNALSLLQQQTGIAVDGTNAQKRAAVKEAVMSLSEKQSVSADVVSKYKSNAEEASNLTNPEPSDASGSIPLTDSQSAIGAAEQNFTGKSDYQQLLSDDNTQPDRADDVRPMEIPKRDADGRNVTEFAANAYGASVTTDAMANEIESIIQDKSLSFDTRTNKQSLKNAAASIDANGEDAVRNKIAQNAAAGVVADGDIEKGLLLYAKYASDPKKQDVASGIIIDLGKLANMSGRNLQLFSLIRRMTPEGQLMTVRKNVSRYVSDINKGRSAKKQIDIDGKRQSVRQVSQAASEAKKNTEKIMSEAGKKTSYRNGKVVVEGNQSGEPFVFEYAQKVGDALATGLERSTNPKKEKTFLQTMTSEIRRFAAEKLPKQQSRKPLTAVELLRDYIQNQEFYNQAWENAQQSLRDRNVNNPDLEEFMNSGIGVDANGNKKNKIFTKALAYSAAKSGETSAILKQQEALGFTNMSETVANYLIQETGATGEMADTIRDAASYYVNDILNADGKGGRPTDQLVESSIRSAMRDIGETLSDTAKSSAETKENVKDRVVDTLVKKYGFGNADAGHVADVVGEQYASMVKAQAQKILQQKFADRPERSKKTTMQIFEELGNLGAFDAGSAYNEKAATKVLGDSYGVSIDEDMANRFLNAKTDEEKIAVMDEIYKDVASRIKPTIGEMWDAWRNLAMLGNPMTHERNIFSTAAFQPFVEVKRNLGAIIEKAFVPKNQRTKSILGVDKNSRALLDFAKQDAKTRAVSDLMSYTASTGDEARSKIQDYRKILPGPLDAVAKKNMALMEGSDMFFKRGEYARSLASFLKARGYTAKQAQSGTVPKGVMEEARTYAVREAQRATFNDRNGFSDWISKLGSTNKNQGAGYAVLNIVKKGIVPFLRTPANVVKRAAEYNPISIATTLFTAKSDIDSGKLSAADVVDRVSSGLTGAAAMGLGAALAAGVVPGIKLIGKVEDENEKREGAQDYSIKIGDRYYGIAWLAPAMIPMFIGANLYNKVNSLSMQDSVDGWDVAQSILEVGKGSINPILELSMLSSLNSFINNISSEETADDKAVAALIGAATSYFSQGLPTVFGQLEKATEKQQSSTYVNTDNKLEKAIKKTLSMASRKIPGIDLYQTEKLDEFGQPVKNAENPMFRAANAIFNPSTVTKEKSDPVTKELTRLSRATGMNVSSNSATYVLSYTDKDGNQHSDYRPTEQEYNTMAKTQGQTVYNISQSLFKTDAYKAMGDAQKAQAVSQIMSYAKEKAKNTALPDAFGFEDSWMEEISSFSPKLQAQYIARRVQSNALANAVSGLVSASKNGFSTSSRLNALDSVYRDYRDMPAADRQNVYSQATGSTRIYLESRDSGVSHAAATKAILAASNAKGTGTNGYVTDADRYTAIAAAGLTKSQTDLVMHAYLPDYNPEAGKTDKAELKYDYIRQEMNLSPADYAKAMSAKSGYTKKKDIIESFEKAGFTNDQANQLYKLFNGNFNVVAWYESIQK